MKLRRWAVRDYHDSFGLVSEDFHFTRRGAEFVRDLHYAVFGTRAHYHLRVEKR